MGVATNFCARFTQLSTLAPSLLEGLDLPTRTTKHLDIMPFSIFSQRSWMLDNEHRPWAKVVSSRQTGTVERKAAPNCFPVSGQGLSQPKKRAGLLIMSWLHTKALLYRLWAHAAERLRATVDCDRECRLSWAQIVAWATHRSWPLIVSVDHERRSWARIVSADRDRSYERRFVDHERRLWPY